MALLIPTKRNSSRSASTPLPCCLPQLLRHSYGRWWHLIAVLTRTERVPLGHRGPLWLQHPVPVSELMGTSAIATKDDATNEVILTFGVVVPDREDQRGVIQLLRGDIKRQGLVKDRVDRVLLYWRLLSFDRLFEVHQSDFDVWIWNTQRDTVHQLCKSC